MRYVASFFPLRQDAELFVDVPEDAPDARYIRAARAGGWARGKEDGTFHPEENVTRAEAAVIASTRPTAAPSMDSRLTSFFGPTAAATRPAA